MELRMEQHWQSKVGYIARLIFLYFLVMTIVYSIVSYLHSIIICMHDIYV